MACGACANERSNSEAMYQYRVSLVAGPPWSHRYRRRDNPIGVSAPANEATTKLRFVALPERSTGGSERSVHDAVIRAAG